MSNDRGVGAPSASKPPHRYCWRSDDELIAELRDACVQEGVVAAHVVTDQVVRWKQETSVFFAQEFRLSYRYAHASHHTAMASSQRLQPFTACRRAPSPASTERMAS